MNYMSTLLLVLLLAIQGKRSVSVGGPLVLEYYKEKCPMLEEIVHRQVEIAVLEEPRMAASLLRLHFHDCFVLGCDASLLLDDFGGIVSEKKAGPNINSLRGFEVIDEIKYLLEEACPYTVSCADILAVAARDAVALRGGPSWNVYLGRRDSLKASMNGANQFIPAPNSSLETLIANFQQQGLDTEDLVALSGTPITYKIHQLVRCNTLVGPTQPNPGLALLWDPCNTLVRTVAIFSLYLCSHTIGKAKCSSFRQRIYSYDDSEETSYQEDSDFRKVLGSICPKSGRDNALAPLDFVTPARFDNHYFYNIKQGEGLLISDNVLVSQDVEGQIQEHVWAFASDEELFFASFANSMIKMGNINVLTGQQGEIRKNCRLINT